MQVRVDTPIELHLARALMVVTPQEGQTDPQSRYGSFDPALDSREERHLE